MAVKAEENATQRHGTSLSAIQRFRRFVPQTLRYCSVMKNQRVSMRLAAPAAEAKPLAERGRMLFVDDVVSLLQGSKSAWWVRNHFAPEFKRKLGRAPYWWESDAVRWLDAQEAA